MDECAFPLPRADRNLLPLVSALDSEFDGILRAVIQPQVREKLRLRERCRFAIDGDNHVSHLQSRLLQLRATFAEQPFNGQRELIRREAELLALGSGDRSNFTPCRRPYQDEARQPMSDSFQSPESFRFFSSVFPSRFRVTGKLASTGAIRARPLHVGGRDERLTADGHQFVTGGNARAAAAAESAATSFTTRPSSISVSNRRAAASGRRTDRISSASPLPTSLAARTRGPCGNGCSSGGWFRHLCDR